MNQHNFSLIPFNLVTAPNIEITGNVLRHQGTLNIEYVLQGDLDKVILPSPKAKSDRLFDLWEHTCLEFFLAIKDTTEYWEFNLSPAGDWNVFHFLSYRHDIAEELNLSSLAAKIVREQDCWKLSLEVGLAKIISPDINLELGITAVIEEQHQLSYWALKHAAAEADFHDRASFAIAL